MISTFADFLLNIGWPFFMLMVALPGLIGLFYVGSELWDSLNSKKAS